MARRTVDIREATPLLDIASYGRRGPANRSLTPGEIQHISRTVARTPEVVIKVSGGARTLRGVASHLEYIAREGKVDVESDQGEILSGKGWEKTLLKDWDLDLEAQQRYTERAIAAGRKIPKLVHNLVFSMPKGTPPEKMLQAVKIFTMEKFALQHRYALALHTDQAHVHVHAVVKAVSEQGQRLNIRKATLREWRRDFAQYLRVQGIDANATERAVRGQPRAPKLDGIYRAMKRGHSTHMRDRAAAVARELASGSLRLESGKRKLLETRGAVRPGWVAVADVLERGGDRSLASSVRRFAASMPSVATEKEMLASQIFSHLEMGRTERMPIR